MTRYIVVVGNLGTVYDGEDEDVATYAYADYVGVSDTGYGRLAFEPVTLFADGEPVLEHEPPPELDPDLERELIEAVKAHAIEHYNENGWDFIVECYDDRDIGRELRRRRLTTIEAAIADFEETARIKDEARREAESEIF